MIEINEDVHLEDWELVEEEQSFTKGNIKLYKREGYFELHLKTMDNNYSYIKNTNNYWELSSMDMFLNDDIEEQVKFQEEYMMYIRDLYSDYEYIVINKITNDIYGVNDLISSEGWCDEILEKMWENNELYIIDILNEPTPKILKKSGWEDLEVKHINGTVYEHRTKNLEQLDINI
jgi:hypothetical protein